MVSKMKDGNDDDDVEAEDETTTDIRPSIRPVAVKFRYEPPGMIVFPVYKAPLNDVDTSSASPSTPDFEASRSLGGTSSIQTTSSVTTGSLSSLSTQADILQPQIRRQSDDQVHRFPSDQEVTPSSPSESFTPTILSPTPAPRKSMPASSTAASTRTTTTPTMTRSSSKTMQRPRHGSSASAHMYVSAAQRAPISPPARLGDNRLPSSPSGQTINNSRTSRVSQSLMQTMDDAFVPDHNSGGTKDSFHFLGPPPENQPLFRSSSRVHQPQPQPQQARTTLQPTPLTRRQKTLSLFGFGSKSTSLKSPGVSMSAVNPNDVNSNGDGAGRDRHFYRHQRQPSMASTTVFPPSSPFSNSDDLEIEIERRVQERVGDLSQIRQQQMEQARYIREQNQRTRSRYNSGATIIQQTQQQGLHQRQQQHQQQQQQRQQLLSSSDHHRASQIDRDALIRSRKEITQPKSSSAISQAKARTTGLIKRSISTRFDLAYGAGDEDSINEGILEPKVVLLGSIGECRKSDELVLDEIRSHFKLTKSLPLLFLDSYSSRTLAVGKTSLARRYAKGEFGSTTTTIQQSVFSRKVSLDGQQVRYQIWDTAGEERYRSVTKIHYRGANAALIVYDISDERSFADVRSWIEDVQNLTEGCIIFVIGNKSDLHKEGRRMIERRVAREWVTRWVNDDQTPFERDFPVPKTPPALRPSGTAIDTYPQTSRQRVPSLYRSKTLGASPTKEETASAVTSPNTSPSTSETNRPSTHRFLSLLSASSPSDIHNTPTSAIDFSPGSRAITRERANSISATSTLMAFATADMSRANSSSKMTTSKSASGFSNLLNSSALQEETSPGPLSFASRRKSEDWSLGRGRDELAVAISGQATREDKSARRRTVAYPSDGMGFIHRSQEPSTQDAADEGWGRPILGTNVRVGEISAKTNKGELQRWRADLD